MADGPGKRLFSAEIQFLKARGRAVPEDADSTSLQPLLNAIAALQGDVRSLDKLMRQTACGGARQSSQAVGVCLAVDEIDKLKAEIDAMSQCIVQTKMEIAALRPADTKGDRLIVVANELDAIVDATERATEGILEAAEKIDNLAHQLQTHGSDSFIVSIADELREAVVRVFEESNFQDITGQRINKVVKTLQFIEERVNRMVDIWGKGSFADLQRPEEHEAEADEEQKLLNGPALANEGISQEDIDKLFD